MENPPLVIGEVANIHYPDGVQRPGGAAFNLAWHLHGLGVLPLLLSRVGDDPQGRGIKHHMMDWRMKTAGLQKDSTFHTPQAFIDPDQGVWELESQSTSTFDRIQYTAIPPIEPILIWHDSLVMRHQKAIHARNKLIRHIASPVYFDVNLHDPWWSANQIFKLMMDVRWVNLNSQDLTKLIPGEDDLKSKASALITRCKLEWVTVTMGEQGAFMVDEFDNLIEQSAPSVSTQDDAIGAGEAFSAICIFGLINDWSREQIMRRAVQFASHSVANNGRLVRDPDYYRRYLDCWRLQSEQERLLSS